MAQTYKYPHPFRLESGVVLPSLEIAYDTYGEMNADRSNIIWVCHALTANSDVADWWPHTVEEGCFLDPALLSNYKAKDYHRFYICEIVDVLVRE